MIRLVALLAALFGAPTAPVLAQQVASDADCQYLADQVAFAAGMRDDGHPPGDVAPGLYQSGIDEGTVEVILGWAYDNPETPPADLAASVLYQCSTGFN